MASPVVSASTRENLNLTGFASTLFYILLKRWLTIRISLHDSNIQFAYQRKVLEHYKFS